MKSVSVTNSAWLLRACTTQIWSSGTSGKWGADQHYSRGWGLHHISAGKSLWY